jgi:hypothetical protein
LERTHEQGDIVLVVLGPENGSPMAKTRKVEVHVTFSDTVRKDNRQTCSIDVASDGSDSVWDVKCRIAVSAPLTAQYGLGNGVAPVTLMTESFGNAFKCLQETFGGSLTADSIFLYFGPNDKKLGRQFAGDPNIDEKAMTLAGFSVLPWLDRFASWHLGAKLMPPTPPPPGVAIKKAAALAEGKDAEKAVQEARAKVGAD